MKKRYIVFLLVLICSIFTSCRHPEVYQLLHEEDQISSISIVAITFDETRKVVQTEVENIEDMEAFLRDFREVDCFTYYGDPIGAATEGEDTIVIKILYENGAYELINWDGQAEYTSKRGFQLYSGFSVFDEVQFDALISKYLPD